MEELRSNATSPTFTTTAANSLTSSLTTTPAPSSQCPQIYAEDVAATTLCQLWNQLQGLKASSSNNNNNNSSSGGGVGASPQLVLCPHRSHATSSTLLCQLWCEIQTFSNKVNQHKASWELATFVFPLHNSTCVTPFSLNDEVSCAEK